MVDKKGVEYKEVEHGGKIVKKIKAPGAFESPVHIKRRKERAAKRRPDWVK